MKSLITFICLFSYSGHLCAMTRLEKLYHNSKIHAKHHDYYTALETIARAYKHATPDQNIQHFLERIVRKTGTYYFNTYTDAELRKLNIPTTDLIMAKRNLYLSKFRFVHQRLKRMPIGHRLFPESLLIKGTAHFIDDKFKNAIATYRLCVDSSNKWLSRTQGGSFRYYTIIKDTCILNIARIHYKRQEYKLAIIEYENIPKASYKWPYTLLEKAWAYHHIGNYNRSLGILMTYNSPLLQSYFTPEAEYLSALNYFKLCLYRDSLKVIDKYYSKYTPKSDRLRSVINNQRSKDLYFFQLMFTPIEETEKQDQFMRNLVTQMSTRLKYNLDRNALDSITAEIVQSNKYSNQKMLRRLQKNLKEQINHYIKVSIYDFINKIHKTASNMFDLKLEILSKQRDLAYKNTKVKKNKKRGNFTNIQRTKNQEVWKFKQAFWADELGEYSFGLASMCRAKRGRRK